MPRRDTRHRRLAIGRRAGLIAVAAVVLMAPGLWAVIQLVFGQPPWPRWARSSPSSSSDRFASRPAARRAGTAAAGASGGRGLDPSGWSASRQGFAARAATVGGSIEEAGDPNRRLRSPRQGRHGVDDPAGEADQPVPPGDRAQLDRALDRAGGPCQHRGPKTRSAHEAPPERVEAAAVAVTDSPAQAGACQERFFTGRDLRAMGGILDGAGEGRRTKDDLTVYRSTGLAGSEMAVAVAMLRGWQP